GAHRPLGIRGTPERSESPSRFPHGRGVLKHRGSTRKTSSTSSATPSRDRPGSAGEVGGRPFVDRYSDSVSMDHISDEIYRGRSGCLVTRPARPACANAGLTRETVHLYLCDH